MAMLRPDHGQPDVVDISSGVEYEDVLIKGKDESKVKAFINAVNN